MRKHAALGYVLGWILGVVLPGMAHGEEWNGHNEREFFQTRFELSTAGVGKDPAPARDGLDLAAEIVVEPKGVALAQYPVSNPGPQGDFPGPGRSDYTLPDGGALHQVFGLGMVLASAGDLATTEVALSQGGFYERNPFQQNRGVRVASHVAVPALVYWVTDRLHKKGRGKLALLARIAVTAVYGFATMHNANALSN